MAIFATYDLRLTPCRISFNSSRLGCQWKTSEHTYAIKKGSLEDHEQCGAEFGRSLHLTANMMVPTWFVVLPQMVGEDLCLHLVEAVIIYTYL